jgi:hypothetical protein
VNALKIVVVVFGLGIAIALILGLLLPRDYQVARDIFIAQPSSVIHPYVNNLERWPEWTPWHDMDETIVTTVGDIKEGVGATQSWIGDSGDGRLVVTRSDPNTGVAYDLFFDSDKWACKAGLNFAPAEGNGTKVVWTMSGTVPIPVLGGYVAKMMSAQVGLAFDDGLAKLKKLVQDEADAAPEPTPEPTPEPPSEPPATPDE